MDYASGPYSIIITAGVVRESFNILISDEREKENDESFTLTIDMISSLLQCEVTVDDHSQTIVNIEDDDGESSATYFVYCTHNKLIVRVNLCMPLNSKIFCSFIIRS